MSALKTFFDSLLGTYTPIVDSNGIIPAGFAGVDWAYLVRALVFALVLYAILRIIGGLICRM